MSMSEAKEVYLKILSQYDPYGYGIYLVVGEVGNKFKLSHSSKSVPESFEINKDYCFTDEECKVIDRRTNSLPIERI